MEEISIGAVGAAIIAGLISIIGLIIGKEQKVSEFRQAWINDLRKCLLDYLVNINAVCDVLRMKKAGDNIDNALLIELYRKLNEANHGIILRINESEAASKKLIGSMERFEEAVASKDEFIPDNIKKIENIYIKDAKNLLRLEWRRVKRGEPIFVWAKRVSFALTVALILLAFYILFFGNNPSEEIIGFRIYPAAG